MSIENRLIAWLLSDDTGMSSKAIARHMTGNKHDWRGASHPLDGGDFARCARLLEQIPEWRERMTEMANYSPAWAALVKHWDDLTEDYRAGKKISEKMDKILADPEQNDPFLVKLGPGVSIRFGS